MVVGAALKGLMQTLQTSPVMTDPLSVVKARQRERSQHRREGARRVMGDLPHCGARGPPGIFDVNIDWQLGRRE